MSIILDLKCAEYGSCFGTVEENILNNAIDVLREDGVYALFLYLDTEGAGAAIRNKAYAFLCDREIWEDLFPDTYDIDNIRIKFSGRLEKLILAKELLERVLVYARYHEKARGGA
jgi:hypothetical protein